MGLTRWEPTTRYIGTGEYMGDMEQDAGGDFYAAADVDALLARIRAAVDAERGATVADTGNASGWVARITKYRAALDALLSDGETVHQCPPDGSRTTPCCGRIPFDLIGDRMATDPSLVTCTGRGSQ